MADAYLLSEEDRSKLQKLMGEHGMSVVRHQPPPPIGGSPEVYVAKVQDDPDTGDPGSIPALIQAGNDDYDHPGCAVCNIYQIMPSDSSEDWDLVPISSFSFPVYNVSANGVGSDWLLVIRSKSGHWLAVTGGSSSAPYILIEDLDGTEAHPYYAKANPGTVNPSTGLLYDEHVVQETGLPIDDPAWTAVLVDPTSGQIPCWMGDWVEASPIQTDLEEEDFDGYSFAKIVSKQSSQMDFFGVLGNDPLTYNGGVSATIYLQARAAAKTVFDFSMLVEGQVLLGSTPIRVTFMPYTRCFAVTQAPCLATVIP
jgi:hypothetical protein